MTAPQALLSRLRRDTRPEHESVERLVDMTRADVTVRDYVLYLETMLSAHEAFESTWPRLSALRAALPDLATRAKAHQLRADLSALGRTPPAHPAPPLDLLAAFGWLYVLEGSTLGARVVHAHLRRALGRALEGAESYLEGYGASRAAKWKVLCDTLERLGAELTESETQRVVRGARDAFEHVERELRTTRSAA